MKFSKFIILLVFMSLFCSTQCNEDDIQQPTMICDSSTIIDNELYQNAESGFFNLGDVELIGDCLSINISASGCSGDTWVMELVDSGGVLESLPVQRNLKFILTNNEACLAVFGKEQSFDLTNLKVEGEDEVILNVEGFPEPISYSY